MDALLTAQQVADSLKVQARTVHRLVREGKIACVQLSPRERRFLPEQIEAFVRSRIIPTPKPIDKSTPPRVLSPPKIQKGGDEVIEGSTRALLRKEMRSWQ